MEDYSSNETVKPEKQGRNIMYICFFGQYVYIHIHLCNVCIELFIYILLLKFAISAIWLEVIPRNAYMTICFRYLPQEEALSLELESYPQ